MWEFRGKTGRQGPRTKEQAEDGFDLGWLGLETTAYRLLEGPGLEFQSQVWPGDGLTGAVEDVIRVTEISQREGTNDKGTPGGRPTVKGERTKQNCEEEISETQGTSR